MHSILLKFCKLIIDHILFVSICRYDDIPYKYMIGYIYFGEIEILLLRAIRILFTLM